MAFIEPNPTPHEPTRDEVIAEIIGNMKRRGSQLLVGLNDYATMSLKQTWADDRYTPQMVFDAMGKDAVSAVDSHLALVVFLADKLPVPNEVLALVKPFTENPDGTVTVG